MISKTFQYHKNKKIIFNFTDCTFTIKTLRKRWKIKYKDMPLKLGENKKFLFTRDKFLSYPDILNIGEFLNEQCTNNIEIHDLVYNNVNELFRKLGYD